MSDSNRGILAAFAGIAALAVATGTGAFYGSVYAPEKRHYQSVGPNSGQSYPHDSPRNGLADTSGIDPFTESLIAKPQPRNTEEREQRDLAAQEAMAVFGYWMFWAIIAQTFLAAGALFALIKDLRQNRTSAETQLRAYVSINPKVIHWFDPSGIIHVEHEAVNHGQTPAKDINYIFDMAVLPASLPPKFSFPPPSLNVQSNSTLFPNVPLKVWHNNSRELTQTEADDVVIRQTHRFYVWGVLTYGDVFGADHQTEFYASVGGADFGQSILNLRSGQASIAFTWKYEDGHNRAT